MLTRVQWGFKVFIDHKILSLGTYNSETDMPVGGLGHSLLKQSVCCSGVHHADKPEASTGIIRYLMCYGENRRDFFVLSCSLSTLYFVLSPATLSLAALTENKDPNQQSNINVAQAVKMPSLGDERFSWVLCFSQTPPLCWCGCLEKLHSCSISPLACSVFLAGRAATQALVRTHCSHQLSSTLDVTKTTTVTPPRPVRAMFAVIHRWHSAARQQG